MDMQQLLKQAQGMQKKFQEAQEQLKDEQFSGQAGGGMVEATVNGQGDLEEIDIKPEVVDPEDVEILEDMILSAIQTATEKANQKQEEILGGMAPGGAGMGGLGNLLG